jgi:hypothetical protein
MTPPYVDQADQSCRDLILKHVACADKFGESATPCLDIELDVKHVRFLRQLWWLTTRLTCLAWFVLVVQYTKCAYQQLAPERWSEFSSCKAQNPADYHEKCKPHQLAYVALTSANQITSNTLSYFLRKDSTRT